MPISDTLLQDALARYARERDRYLKLAARVADICRIDIVEASAIRAQVTSRAKGLKNFGVKLRRYSAQGADLHTVDGIFERVGDLAGVRIATYRAEDEVRVVDEILKLFSGPAGAEISVDMKDKMNEGGFYRATHCQVFLKEDELVGTYENLTGTSCEIQVCSMMAHVWNEIEHDIGYKQEGGGPQDTENRLLKALGHLTRSGDQTISSLLEANLARREFQTGDFMDVFDFVARLRKSFPEADLSLHAGQLFEELKTLDLASPEKLEGAIGKDRLNQEEARRELNRINELINDNIDHGLTLVEQSSDLILSLILKNYADKIVENHPAGRGKGRPPRIRSIAARYQDLQIVEHLQREAELTANN